MKPLEPVLVTHLFPDERAALLDVLRSLDREQWERPTVCVGWSVGDIARHLVADDLGRLSRERDSYTTHGFTASSPERLESELLTFINAGNEAWVAATRRLSPAIVIDLLEWCGRETQAHFESLDMHAIGGAVTWAGPEPAPKWLDVAREYTERWLHQQQIRDAVKRPVLRDRRFLGLVLETFVRALPHTYRGMEAAADTHVKLIVSGEAGGEWSLVRRERGWLLGRGEESTPAATVRLDQSIAWRLFTNGLSEEQAREAVRVEGDEALGAKILDAVAIIA